MSWAPAAGPAGTTFVAGIPASDANVSTCYGASLFHRVPGGATAGDGAPLLILALAGGSPSQEVPIPRCSGSAGQIILIDHWIRGVEDGLLDVGVVRVRVMSHVPRDSPLSSISRPLAWITVPGLLKEVETWDMRYSS